ncbi:Cytochrome P450 monooxygenase gsfF [Colletotrichum siamense]|uniref:Cytochrome P450 monooxygenase gsfF n=1 Tax=Colletotrichum siamense TaxID=690259 RepID=UPI001872BA1E|nr:Cytochrome P450 monooxygenase gsfF [Colletotrichum siamense]KAF5486925.1 Cytochrome P450 monooxygenase gsfF [Colletotrichum siamense]
MADAFPKVTLVGVSTLSLGPLIAASIFSALLLRIIYNLYFHPLSRFQGPWYAASFSISHAIISVLKKEPQWMLSLAKHYGTDKPIRIAPNVLLFPQPAALKDIYCNPKCDTKSEFYGTGVLGPPHLFATLDSNDHKILRKALGGPHWSIGAMKRNWESRFDSQIQQFLQQMTEVAEKNEPVVLCDRMVEFAADIMTMICFSEPWGFVSNKADQRQILRTWRNGQIALSFLTRFRWLRDRVTRAWWGPYLQPSPEDKFGVGYIMGEANRQVAERERRIDEEGFSQEYPDLMQFCLEARIDGQPLTLDQKRAHATLLIIAGADTTATTLGCTMRFIMKNPAVLARVRAELAAAESAGRLSTPIQHEETRENLPFFVACVKESIRLNPSAAQLFGRVAPAGGIAVDGKWIPGGSEMTSLSYVVHRDPVLYAPDPEVYRPERWLEGETGGNTKEVLAEMEAANFGFGMGPRVCMGKDIAMMEIYKLIPEFIRMFDLQMEQEGRYVVIGGMGINEGLVARLRLKD